MDLVKLYQRGTLRKNLATRVEGGGGAVAPSALPLGTLLLVPYNTRSQCTSKLMDTGSFVMTIKRFITHRRENICGPTADLLLASRFGNHFRAELNQRQERNTKPKDKELQFHLKNRIKNWFVIMIGNSVCLFHRKLFRL